MGTFSSRSSRALTVVHILNGHCFHNLEGTFECPAPLLGSWIHLPSSTPPPVITCANATSVFSLKTWLFFLQPVVAVQSKSINVLPANYVKSKQTIGIHIKIAQHDRNMHVFFSLLSSKLWDAEDEAGWYSTSKVFMDPNDDSRLIKHCVNFEFLHQVTLKSLTKKQIICFHHSCFSPFVCDNWICTAWMQ